MADINIKFDSVSSGGGSADQYLINVLQKLNASIDKLSANQNKIMSIKSGNNSIFSSGTKPFEQVSKDMNRAVMDFNSAAESALKGLGERIGNTLATSAMAALGVTILRIANNETNAIMGRATAAGRFAGAGIAGNANQDFSNYVGSLYDIERQRRIANNFALAEGAGGLAGSAVGAGVGVAAAVITKKPFGIGGAAATGGAIGAGTGEYLAAKYKNADIEREMLLKSAMAQRDAAASVSEWKTGFSRFGLGRTPTQIAGSDITGGSALNVPLSGAFQGMYGKSQNFNAILNNIVPYLTSNPVDKGGTGDLNKVSQNFLKAGFAVSDFTRLTMQSSMFTALTGKNIEAFSEDIKKARTKFGDSFDATSMQTSLNLMAVGYGKNQAQQIAFQSQFNPGLAGNVARFNNMGIQEFYQNKALSSVLGFDISKSLQSGTFVGSEASKKELQKELQDFRSGKNYGSMLTVLNAAGGFNPASLASLVQNQVKVAGGVSEDSNLSPAQKQAQDIIGAIQNGLSNVQNMTVNAQSVVVMNNGIPQSRAGSVGYSTSMNMAEGAALSRIAPSAHSAGASPAKK